MEENNNQEFAKVPVKSGFWQSFKAFWLQPIVLELTPYQKKVFQEVHDFWNQEIHVENGSIVLKKAQEEKNEVEPEVTVSL